MGPARCRRGADPRTCPRRSAFRRGHAVQLLSELREPVEDLGGQPGGGVAELLRRRARGGGLRPCGRLELPGLIGGDRRGGGIEVLERRGVVVAERHLRQQRGDVSVSVEAGERGRGGATGAEVGQRRQAGAQLGGVAAERVGKLVLGAREQRQQAQRPWNMLDDVGLSHTQACAAGVERGDCRQDAWRIIGQVDGDHVSYVVNGDLELCRLLPGRRAGIEHVAQNLLGLAGAGYPAGESPVATLARLVVAEHHVQPGGEGQGLFASQAVDIAQVADRAQLDPAVFVGVGGQVGQLQRDRRGSIRSVCQDSHHLAAPGVIERSGGQTAQQVPLPRRQALGPIEDALLQEHDRARDCPMRRGGNRPDVCPRSHTGSGADRIRRGGADGQLRRRTGAGHALARGSPSVSR